MRARVRDSLLLASMQVAEDGTLGFPISEEGILPVGGEFLDVGNTFTDMNQKEPIILHRGAASFNTRSEPDKDYTIRDWQMGTIKTFVV